jgi:hypothetical protein
MRRLIALLAAIMALAASLVAFTASPAVASVVTYGCNPSVSGWATAAAWSGGTVMEARACLQYDTATPYHRVRVEWRMRRGTTALNGTDWDLDPSYYTEILTVYGVDIGRDETWSDIFNKSYIVTYSGWGCAGSASSGDEYRGVGWLIRATPPGLTKSGYHTHRSNYTNFTNISCG